MSDYLEGYQSQNDIFRFISREVLLVEEKYPEKSPGIQKKMFNFISKRLKSKIISHNDIQSIVQKYNFNLNIMEIDKLNNIQEEINSSAFIIVNLANNSYHKGNKYLVNPKLTFIIGLAYGIGKPVILIADPNKIPGNLQGFEIIDFNLGKIALNKLDIIINMLKTNIIDKGLEEIFIVKSGEHYIRMNSWLTSSGLKLKGVYRRLPSAIGFPADIKQKRNSLINERRKTLGLEPINFSEYANRRNSNIEKRAETQSIFSKNLIKKYIEECKESSIHIAALDFTKTYEVHIPLDKAKEHLINFIVNLFTISSWKVRLIEEIPTVEFQIYGNQCVFMHSLGKTKSREEYSSEEELSGVILNTKSAVETFKDNFNKMWKEEINLLDTVMDIIEIGELTPEDFNKNFLWKKMWEDMAIKRLVDAIKTYNNPRLKEFKKFLDSKIYEKYLEQEKNGYIESIEFSQNIFHHSLLKKPGYYGVINNIFDTDKRLPEILSSKTIQNRDESTKKFFEKVEEIFTSLLDRVNQEEISVCILCSGSGCLTSSILNRYPKVKIYEIDKSKPMLESSCANQHGYPKKIEQDLTKKIQDESIPKVDLVLALGCLRYFSEDKEIKEFISNIEKMLNNNGKILLAETSEDLIKKFKEKLENAHFRLKESNEKFNVFRNTLFYILYKAYHEKQELRKKIDNLALEKKTTSDEILIDMANFKQTNYFYLLGEKV